MRFWPCPAIEGCRTKVDVFLSLAAVLEAWSGGSTIGGMDRQTLRDWVHRFNEHGLAGLLDTTSGSKCGCRWISWRNWLRSLKLAPR